MKFIEVIYDEPGFFREIRVGYWRLVTDHETGEGEWYWEGQRAEAAEDMRPALRDSVVRRS